MIALSPRHIAVCTFVIAICFFGVMPALAQTDKGKFAVGGNVDISDEIQGKYTNFNLSLAPSIGLFLVKNLIVGGTYSFTVGSSNNYNSSNNTTSQLTTFTSEIGPLLKYYIGKKALKGVVSAHADYLVFTAIGGGSLSNYNGFAAGGQLGMAYFFNPYISLEMGYYLNVAGFEKQLPITRTGLSLGVYTFLDKKKKE